jgi:hypothetical protein
VDTRRHVFSIYTDLLQGEPRADKRGQTVSIKGKHTLALYKALRGGKQNDLDAAAVELAKEYARALDSDSAFVTLGEIGPKYLACLTALGLTVAGRNQKGSAGVQPASKIDELRQRRARRDSAG